jgi:hypothetical protein
MTEGRDGAAGTEPSGAAAPEGGRGALLRPPRGHVPARFRGPLSRAEAEAELRRIGAARPELAAPPARPGCLRGIDAYPPGLLAQVYRIAANQFHARHGRLPDPASPRGYVEHLFALKFLHEIPLDPAPGDKLAAHRFLPPDLRARAGLPARPWVSAEPALPDDAALSPGRYWLKVSVGNAMQCRIDWPPGPAERARAEARGRAWLRALYGVIWGEWWYGTVRPRLFLEADLGPAMAGRPEISVFCRGGRVRKLLAHRWLDPDTRSLSFYDPQWRKLPGRLAGHAAADEPRPGTLPLMIEAAEAVARHFDFVRVDFLNPAGPKPVLGELTLCVGNALMRHEPAGFDRLLGRLVFG